MAKAAMIFPDDFLWGTATAAHQVEGNNQNNDWWRWEQEGGRILQNGRSGLACNWWQNAEADLDRAAEMGTNAHRLSLEWSRIEPEPAHFNEAALARYRDILLAMHARQIEPMVTLHHFSNPLWLTEKGDFNSDIVPDYFQRYTAKVVAYLGDLVPKWVPINEPMVYVFLRYLDKVFPAPSRGGMGGAMEALRQMLRCHAVAYHTIKAAYPGAQVGVAHNMAVLEARPGSSWAARRWAHWLGWLYNESWLDSLVDGRFHLPLSRGKVHNLAGTMDFVGINYYTRFYVKFPPVGGAIEHTWEPGAIISDGNYGEVYPAGLFQVIKRALKYNKPIYITENGVPDAADRLRPSFILTHLREIWRAISFNFPVMGYYHWTLVDNFEWDRGWTQRFGLIALDEQTQERQLRRSGQLYGEICHQRQINSEMAARYAPELLPVLFPGESPATAV